MFSWAEMIGTETLLESQESSINSRQEVINLLDRENVVTHLEKLGLSKDEALKRINSLTDEEVADLVNDIDPIVAGGFDDEDGWAYILAILVVVAVLGCLSFCWVFFL